MTAGEAVVGVDVEIDPTGAGPEILRKSPNRAELFVRRRV